MNLTRNRQGVGVAADGQRTVQHVHHGVGSVVIVGGEIGVLDDVRESDGVAVGLAQFIHAAQPTSLKKLVNGIVSWSEHRVRTVGAQKVHHLGTGHNLGEFTETGRFFEVVRGILTFHHVHEFRVRVVVATGQLRYCQHGEYNCEKVMAGFHKLLVWFLNAKISKLI